MAPLLFLLAVQLGPMAPDAPARQAQMAARGSSIAVAFGAGNAVYSSVSPDAGKTFSQPVKVAEAANMLLGSHRGPRIAYARNTIVITTVMGKPFGAGLHGHGLWSAGDLLAWRSADGGKNWSAGAVINDAPGSAGEGLHTLASDGNTRLFAAWLDTRGGHGTKLYGAISNNSGATWSKNVLIYESPDATVCECCHPSVAIDSGGQILVMWRNWLAGSRDMYLARSPDGVSFSRAEKLGTGTWKLDACPMDGGGLAVSQDHIVTAWRREHEIFFASAGQAEARVGAGTDVAITGSKEGVYAIWSTPAGIQALMPGKPPVTIASRGAFPSILALLSGRVLAAWEDSGKIIIQPVP